MTVLVCEFCEVLTVSLGALGAGYLFSQNLVLQKILGVLGAAFLIYYGYKSYKSAANSHAHIDIARQKISMKEVVLASLSISLLNPWALMDTMVIIGGGAAQYESLNLVLAFLMGSFTVSTIWFSLIGFGAKRFQHFLNTPKVQKGMDLIAAGIMWFSAIVLLKIVFLG